MTEVVSHLAGFAVLVLLIVAPVPWCRTLASIRNAQRVDHDPVQSASVVLVTWIAILGVVAMLLGMAGHFTAVSLVVAMLVVFVSGLNVARRHVSSYPQPAKILMPSCSHEFALIETIAIIAIFLFWWTCTYPTKNHDSLMYHLPAIAEWYQQEKFVLLPQWVQISRYPYTWEALLALFVFPFAEDFAVATGNWIAWILLGVSIVNLSNQLGARRLYGIAMACLVMSMPMILRRVNSAQVDIAFAALFLAGTFHGVAYLQKKSSIDLGIWLFAALSLLGIKMSGVMYAPLALVAPLIIGGQLHLSVDLIRRIRCSLAGTLFHAASACIVGVLFSGFWYVRNLNDLGNPLGHVRLAVGDYVLFPGDMDPMLLKNTTLAALFEFANSEHLLILFRAIVVNLGVPFITISLLSCAGLFTILRTATGPSRQSLIRIWILAVICGWLYWTSPYSADNGTHGWTITPWIKVGFRYGFPFVGVLAVAAAVGMTRSRVSETVICRVANVAIIIGAVASGIIGVRTALLTVVMLISIGVVLKKWSWTRRKWMLPRTWPSLPACTLAVGLLIVCLGIARHARRDHRASMFYNIERVLETADNEGDVVGYTGLKITYPLYGPRLDRVVRYVPSDHSNWHDDLRRAGVSIVAPRAVGADFETIMSEPENFELLLERQGKIPALYRVKTPITDGRAE